MLLQHFAIVHISQERQTSGASGAGKSSQPPSELWPKASRLPQDTQGAGALNKLMRL